MVDLFYKLRSLHQLGVNLHLHCFTQGRPPQQELNAYCASVQYYPRKKNIGRFSFRLPFIVNSRVSSELIANLQKDDHPVLLEGIHCTYYLDNGQLHDRKILVRLHNTEYEYYRQLAKQEMNLFKKMYLINESRLLKKYEQGIANKALFLAVSDKDEERYRQQFNAQQVHYLPVFLPYTLSAGKEGKGCFCLYQGNLSVSENEQAAIWLLKNVFSQCDIPFVIAGKAPSKKLLNMVHRQKNTCLVADPSQKEMEDLVAKAQLHILPSFNTTGIKLKLLNALFNGRHCLVNPAAMEGSGLEPYCHIANDAAAFRQQMLQLFQQPFTEQEIQERQGLLQDRFNNEMNAKRLMTFLS